MENKLRAYLESRYKPVNVNTAHKGKLGAQNKVALWVTGAIGTMYAVYIFLLFILGWMLWQSYTSKPFDPYPFAFLLFLGNVIQLILMPLIMVGQNIQSKHAEIRAEEEYRATVSSYRDIEQILTHLDRQDEQMKKQLDILLELTKKKK